ncbi:MAG: hypothetical protein HY530_05075 [Chloroflexi bacterium]|nr:hypothetical protein [Chloroflexota bacterium]
MLVASEYPEVRYFLREIVEEKARGIIIGQADNAARALALARDLRPDIAIVDCYLPYAIGLDAVPLSRIGGLDTAQAISAEIPNTRVIVVNNLDLQTLPQLSVAPKSVSFLSGGTNQGSAGLTLQELYQETAPLLPIVFASIRTEHQSTVQQRLTTVSDKAVLFGGLGIVAGLFLMLTLVLAGAGVFLATGGAAAMLFGLAGKLTTSLRSGARLSGKRDRRDGAKPAALPR